MWYIFGKLPFWAQIAILAAFVGASWWAWDSFKDRITAPAVAAALADERAVQQPIIDELAQRVADRDATIADKVAAFKRESDRQTEEADAKQKLYKKVLAQNAKLSKLQNNAIPSPEFVADGVRNLTAASGDSTCASDSDDRRRLGAAIAQCETDLNQQLRATETATDIATKALAAARALRN
jgi:hypothetical protein